MDISVGDFAEQLLLQDQLKAKASPSQDPSFEEDTSFYSSNVIDQAPDISTIEVPDNFVTSITENKELVIPQEAPTEEEISTPPESHPVSEMTELGNLIKEVRELLAEMKNTLLEMTAVGGLGVSMVPNKSKTPLQQDPYAALRKRLKKRKVVNK
jgi:hypothetical protein